jgi:UDP-N-acetylmuramoyl-tripeptide--D-alanyl-D-alanine ligase
LFELSTVTFGEGFLEEFDVPLAIEPIYGQDEFGTWLLEMAHWQVDVHETLRRKRNTGYAYEGMVPAWTWASHLVATRDDKVNVEELQATAQKIQCTMEKGLSKLISWQVGMGVEEDAAEWDGIKGLGGIQNAAHESPLRIDVTQHQMHATILTRRLVYPPTGGEVWPWSEVELSQQ